MAVADLEPTKHLTYWDDADEAKLVETWWTKGRVRERGGKLYRTYTGYYSECIGMLPDTANKEDASA